MVVGGEKEWLVAWHMSPKIVTLEPGTLSPFWLNLYQNLMYLRQFFPLVYILDCFNLLFTNLHGD